ncbi:hypothetical protein ACN4EE_18660 [Geminocystis sp. CENA526]|uniref:hypothetical protein n=1 Tax=Geminocystis sp. CENA526 TaxID=1355871 RepID=UPI003D6F1644
MEIQHLKILLKLLGQNNYQGKIGDIKPNTKTKIEETQKFCYKLWDSKLIHIQEKNITIKINNNGKKVLTNKENRNQLEINILKKCEKTKIKISEINITPASKRDLLIDKLVRENLIDIVDKKIIHGELTEAGKQYLAEEYLAEGLGNVSLPKALLNNYLTFIRNYFMDKISSTKTITSTVEEENINPPKLITPDDILQTIIRLDRTVNTDNYLPIFHLRNEYKSVLSKDELNSMIFTLQKENKISLSRLVDASQYTEEEYDAGIPQSIGYPIFYLIVK